MTELISSRGGCREGGGSLRFSHATGTARSAEHVRFPRLDCLPHDQVIVLRIAADDPDFNSSRCADGIGLLLLGSWSGEPRGTVARRIEETKTWIYTHRNRQKLIQP